MKDSLRLLILTILFINFSQISIAQKMSNKIYEGYVVLTSKDTLHGKIKMLTPALNEVKVSFINKDKKECTFKASEILSYAFQIPYYNVKYNLHERKWINYVKRTIDVSPIPFASKNVLVHRPEKGAINLYNYYTERPGDKRTPIQHTYYVEKKNNELLAVTVKNYKKVLKELMEDYPELQEKIGKKGFAYNQIEEVIDTYNNWILYNTEEISFEARMVR